LSIVRMWFGMLRKFGKGHRACKRQFSVLRNFGKLLRKLVGFCFPKPGGEYKIFQCDNPKNSISYLTQSTFRAFHPIHSTINPQILFARAYPYTTRGQSACQVDNRAWINPRS
jgi:hypothetical protein